MPYGSETRSKSLAMLDDEYEWHWNLNTDGNRITGGSSFLKSIVHGAKGRVVAFRVL
jgi:hypothetical protein